MDKILAENKSIKLNQDFVDLTQKFRKYLEMVRSKFDEFDSGHQDNEVRNNFVGLQKKVIFKELDFYFEKIWGIVKSVDKHDYKLYQRYFQKMILPLIEELSEVNRQIYRKPLGYPGDYIVMNYIFDYSGDRYLGKTSYEKLINNYTCNVTFSISNVMRKEFFKKRVLEMVEKGSGMRILSVGSGPARELLELVEEGKINKKLTFTCLDLEKKVLDYVKDKIKKLGTEDDKFLDIKYFHKNIIDLIRDKELKKLLMNQDLIYASGLFDYLRERFASRLTKELFQLLNKGSSLFICNASAVNFSHRAYYELLGDWDMNHRTKEEMLSWTRTLNNISEVKFEDLTDSTNYLFLNIKKL